MPLHAQNKNRSKISKYNDTVTKYKPAVVKASKVLAVDTIKKSNRFSNLQELVQDSLFLDNGKFKTYKKSAHASYYADKFHNCKTASGGRYDKNGYTAAHKKLPFGTIVRVTNEANGKEVLVEIKDRGPFVRSRDIDLSKKAFIDIIGNKSSGRMTVTLEILQR
jgi:rare lipoprotein A